MARIRTIKPTFFRSRSVKSLTPNTKLVWIGLWNLADDEGRLADELGILAGDLWALSLSEAKLDRALDELDAAGRIIRYVVAGQGFIQVTNWLEHQKISHPTPSTLPPDSLRDDSVRAPGVLRGGREGKGLGMEGEGSGDPEPPRKCSRHASMDIPPKCGQCADAREAHDAWRLRHIHDPLIPSSVIRADPVCEHDRPAGTYCDICQGTAVAS